MAINGKLVKIAKEFTSNQLKPIAREIDQADRFPDELLAPMVEKGFFGLHYPEKFGGGGYSSETAYQVLTELAKGSAGISLLFLVHWMAIDVLLKYGTDDQQEKYLKDLITGKKIAAYSLTEPQAGSDMSEIETIAQKVEQGWQLKGTKYFCTNGGIADVYFIAANTEDDEGRTGLSLFIVEQEAEGFKIGPAIDKMGCRSSDTTSLLLKDCVIPEENLVGGLNQGVKIAMYGLTEGRLGMAAMGLGIAEAALEAAVDYANQREAFGKPIGKLYSIQEMVAEMYVKLEAARPIVKKCCEQRDQDQNYATESCVAKLFVAETVNKVCYNALQVFGGHGYVKNNDVERYARDARLMDIGVGASEVLKMVVGNTVLRS